MLGTSYVLENDIQFKAAIERASQVSQDLRVPFGLIGQDFYKSERAIFQLKGPGLYPDFAGKKNPDTGKTRYQAAKNKAVGFEYPLLVRSGKLAASLTSPTAPGAIFQNTPLSLLIGTTIDYGIYHQSDAPRKKIPLRKFIFIGPEAPRFANSEQQGRLQRWLAILQDHIDRKTKAALQNA